MDWGAECRRRGLDRSFAPSPRRLRPEFGVVVAGICTRYSTTSRASTTRNAEPGNRSLAEYEQTEMTLTKASNHRTATTGRPLPSKTAVSTEPG
jgi:hypothetical protein